MAFSFLAREAGRVHVCGHRGYSLHYPENTLPAFVAAKAWGATTIEIDVVLTAEAEPIVLHDRTLDRTTDGHGFAADFALAQIRSLDAGARFDPRFAGHAFQPLRRSSIGQRPRRSGSFSRSRRPSGRTSPSIEWWRCSKREA
jgi:glycerophosphoryl diester phosphodiesterase